MSKNKASNYGVPNSALGKNAPDPSSRPAAGSGTVNGLPFATRDGQAKGPSADPCFYPADRRQSEATAGPPPSESDISAQSRPQNPGSFAQRLAPQSMPADGTRPDAIPFKTPSYRAGTGSISDGGAPVAGKPFKNLNG
jgi:hypothetical protein